jgi:hypothetical protein
MILGSVGTGMLIGLTGALMVWAGGHAPSMVLLSYSVIGSLGTVCIAVLASGRKSAADPFRG